MADFFNRIIQPFVKRNNWSKANQQQHYKRQYNIFDHQDKKYGRQMVPSATEMEDVSAVSAGEFQQHTGQLNSFIYRTEPNKLAKLSAWREMAMFPEIAFALGEIEDEAINFDDNGEFIELVIKNDRLLQNENIARNLISEFKYIAYDLMQADKNINEYFNEFMTDGEIMFEKVVDPVTAKERGLLRVKRLRPEYTHPIWEEIESDKIYQFIHRGDSNIIVMPPEMVAYANSGIFRYPDRQTKEVLSYLEIGKIDYRKLRQLEDALVIYRLCLDGETRIKTDNGYKYIKDIEIGDIVYSYNNGILYKTKVSNKWNNGTKETIKIRSRHNDITCTVDHPILIKNIKTQKIEYIDAGKLEIKKHQLIHPKFEEQDEKTKIPTSFGEQFAKLTTLSFKNSNIKNKSKIVKNISNEIGYPFNRIWQFLYTENKAIPKDKAIIVCEKLNIPLNGLIFLNKSQINHDRLNIPEYVDVDFARLFGFMIGDGSISKNCVVFAEGEHKDVNELYSGLLKKYFGVCNRTSSKNRTYTNYKTDSTIAVKIFESLGYMHGYANKRIPQWVFNSSNEIKMAFIEGLSDADGCERYTNNGTWFSTIQLTNKKLIEDIKEIWNSLNLSSGKITHRQARVSTGIANRLIHGKESWVITLTKIPLDEYENVISIDTIGMREVYDIEVESEHHNFIANGIPVHNCRAPERRVFKIEVGKLPKQKAEQYVQALAKKYRQRKTYDPATGEASQIIDTQAMVEDFFLPSQDGKGSSIETLPGGENLGEIDDVLYFLDKLYRSMRIPMSRVKSDTGFSLGDTSDITREEVRFNKMVQKFVNRFSQVFLDIFMSHIRLKGLADQWGLTERDFRVKIYSNNLFEEFLETNIMSQRAENFERFIDYAEPDENGKALFSKKWLLKKFLKFSEEDVLSNEEYLKSELADLKKSGSAPMGDSGSDSGSDFGGGSGGGLDLGGDSGGSEDTDISTQSDTGDTSEPETVDDVLDQEKKGGSDETDLKSFA